MVERIDKESLAWRGKAPVSTQFDDVYYSEENGLEETKFVFLKGIAAPECWEDADQFVIAETGFGTGLNFLATYRAWLDSAAKGTLTFVSVEKFPLSEAALREAHKTFPDLEKVSEELCAAWPPPSPGMHTRSFFNGKVKLILMFGDAAECYASLSASVDAWYLDGFAPAKNPEMWTYAVFDEITRLSKQNTCFATFTAAGFVKRGLRDRGFNVQKTKGYGRKRERLVGTMESPDHQSPVIPDWASLPLNNGYENIVVVGAGIAGAAVARALQERGKAVTVVSNGEEIASEVPAAILSPGFQRGVQPSSLFTNMCFAHACSYPHYDSYWAEKRGVKLTSEDETEQKRLAEILTILGWGSDWIEAIDKGFYLPKSGTLRPAKVINHLLKGITTIIDTVSGIEHTGDTWQIQLNNGSLEADAVIIAGGMNSDILLDEDQGLDLRPKPGQIEVVDADDVGLDETSHAFGGYITAPTEGIRTIGSTFDVSPEDGRLWPKPLAKNTLSNLTALNEATGAKVCETTIKSSWAGVRATTPDYLPYVGPVPKWKEAAKQFQAYSKDKKIKGLGDMPYQEGLFLMTGFGAKGFQQAPLCAEYIAALICKEPLPFPSSLVPYLHPGRHMIKSIVRSHRP